MSTKWRGVVSAMVALVALLLVVMVACVRPEVYRTVTETDRPECRHEIYSARVAETGTLALRNFVGDKLNIPEFHDCQRLIDNSEDGSSYGVLAAVFARQDDPRELGNSSWVAAMEAMSDEQGFTLAMIHIPSRSDGNEDAYPPLAIDSAMVNGCVVAFAHEARLLRFRDDTDCEDTYSRRELDEADAPTLSLLELRSPRNPRTSPVARWAYDDVTATHFLEVACGATWCAIGQNGFSTTSRDARLAARMAAPSMSDLDWGAFDDQYLAEFRADSNGIGRLSPSSNWGTVSPHADLAPATTYAHYDGTWVQSAEVMMQPEPGSYYASLGFVSYRTADDLATVSICRSSWAAMCKPSSWRWFQPWVCPRSSDGRRWYARVSAPNENPRFFCVTYREHTPHVEVPPLVRWRWLPEDETIWVRCPYGCCEVAIITKGGAQT